MDLFDATEYDELQAQVEKVPTGLSCPECCNNMMLKQVVFKDKKDKRKAWFCVRSCGRQSYDEFGKR